MYRILQADKLAANIYRMVVEAPRIAARCLPGQFLIAKSDEEGERIPLTICDYDREAGTVTIVFQPVGASTTKMAELKAGDAFMDFVGPLGRPSDLVDEPVEELKKKKILFIAGGVGTAPVYPQVKWLHEQGVTADAIIGAKSKDFVILEKEFSEVCNLFVTTDDGSYGRSGMVTKCLEDLIAGIALYRPGPMSFIPSYIRGKEQQASIRYDTPELENILKATYGCIVYQEQVM